MVSDPERSPAPIARQSRWRPLNLQLMRVVLRVYSTAEYDEEEGRLCEMLDRDLGTIAFRDLGRITEEKRNELILRFLVRWRSGQLTGFSRRYIRWALADVRKRERAAGRGLVEDGQAQSEAARDRRGLAPDDIVQLEEIESRFRGSLPTDIERELLDAWIENGDRQGWQREFARLRVRSDRWVSDTMKRFRLRLKEEQEVQDPDALVELLGSLRDAEDDTPSTHLPVVEEAGPEEAPGERALVLRERLRESFDPGSRERQLFDHCSAGYSREEIQRWYLDEETLLLGLHQRYVCLGQELASGSKHVQEAMNHA